MRIVAATKAVSPDPIPVAIDSVYRIPRDLYERLARGRQSFDILSVGMTGDYERAIAFGSDMVRIGTAIFGRRN